MVSRACKKEESQSIQNTRQGQFVKRIKSVKQKPVEHVNTG